MFDRVLVANRGEIACRIIRTCRQLGVHSVAVYSEADAGARHVREADSAVSIGPAPAVQSYLSARNVLAAAQQAGVDAVHPGYGFLSESASFADAVRAAGLAWVGPGRAAMTQMADKINARNVMAAAGVPVAPGTTDLVDGIDAAIEAARDVEYPIMLKAAAGGGGIGMTIVRDEAQLRAEFDSAAQRAQRVFGDGSLLLERYLPHARHVEAQILGPGDGTVVALGERDCSVQRRHQKVIEETPSPGITAAVREDLLAAAVRAGEAVDYVGAGTVEFLVFGSGREQRFVFLEMNTRLQVEHPVTELVFGLDLVQLQLQIAAGEPVRDVLTRAVPAGHAIELRVYAEDPIRFLPGPGHITRWREPDGTGVRVDSGYDEGDTVTPYYDPLLAKLCVWGPDRSTALERAREAVKGFVVEGPKVNLPLFTELLDSDSFVSGDYDTGLITNLRG